MIIELYIRNFALIEEARISFGPGLTILTGETGAGKSIVLDAIALLMGGRASADFVRQGTERATLEAVFLVNTESNSGDAMHQLLEEAGIDWSSEGTLVIARDLMLNGKTVSRINGRIVTVNLLKQIAPFLLDMAGQHENQSLLRPDEHLLMIDVFGGAPIAEWRRRVAHCFADYQQIKKQLQNAQLGEQERAIRIDMLRYQLQEIDAVALKPDEEADLEQERRRLAYAEKLYSMSNSVYTGLYEGEERSPAVLDGLATLVNELESAVKIDSSLQPSFELLKSAQVQMEEVAHDMRGYRDDIEF
ncbi:MAG: repair protein RecN, partial [Bacilli bacterium]|nr:repair protein RecN [Bacilli bacterium]